MGGMEYAFVPAGGVMDRQLKSRWLSDTPRQRALLGPGGRGAAVIRLPGGVRPMAAVVCASVVRVGTT